MEMPVLPQLEHRHVHPLPILQRTQTIVINHLTTYGFNNPQTEIEWLRKQFSSTPLAPTNPTIYIAGPMTGIAGYNFPAFHAAEKAWRDAGWDVRNPAHNPPMPGWTHAMYLRRDIPLLLECNAIALLPKWTRSRGACFECSVAQHLDMTIYNHNKGAVPPGTPGEHLAPTRPLEA